MKAICSATKPNGEPCTLPAQGQQHGLCWAHDPANREKRRRVASRGGRGKAAKRVNELWDKIELVINNVESESLSPQQGNTMLRGYSTLIALARHAIEEGELEIARRRLALDEEERTDLRHRLEELEEALQQPQRGRYFGA